MQIFDKNNMIYNFEYGMKENYKVKSGEIFLVKTCDCFHQQITDETQLLFEIDMDIINPATGPIYVENAEVGDILKVEILDIKVDDSGIVAAVPGEGGLAEISKEPIISIIPIENGYAKYLGKNIPINPMIGVIGVAPAKKDGKWGTHTPWKHGGNMDSKVITKGNTLYFDINQKGGMLALGDLHAVMGDGELSFTGLEISGEVLLKASVIKSENKLEWPILESKEHIEFLVSGDDIEDATKKAAKIGVEHLQKSLNISWPEAYTLSSLVMDLRISQIVNAKKTVRSKLPKYILDIKDIIK